MASPSPLGGQSAFVYYVSPGQVELCCHPESVPARGMGVTAVAEFDKDIQALLSRHRRVVARVGFIGFFEAGKCPCRFSTLTS